MNAASVDNSAQRSTQRRAPGWFLVFASIGGILLVLFQMSNNEFSTLRPDPSPPVVEPTPPLWTPRAATPSDQIASLPAPTITETPQVRAPLPTERVRVAVNEWAQAWRSRDVQAYLAFYDPNFQNRVAFARQKQRVIGRAEFIEVKISQVKLTPLDNGATEARFIQTYRSDTFENQTLKRQVWQAGSDGRLRIVEETS
jgi:hypothetical protein